MSLLFGDGRPGVSWPGDRRPVSTGRSGTEPGRLLLGEAPSAVRVLPATGECLLVLEGDPGALAALRADWWRFGLWATLVSGALAFLLGRLVARRLLRPLHELTEGVKRARSNGGGAGLRLEPGGPSEVRDLAAEVSSLLEAIAGRGRQVDHFSAGLEMSLARRTTQLTELGAEPFVSRGEGRAARAERASLLETGLRERLRILVVEDNTANQQLLNYLLGRRGYSTDVAGDGRSAVDSFAAGDYDLVLMDCQMPNMDGFEATRHIRSMGGAGAHVPILAMTASATSRDRARCLEVGMSDHMAKPIQPSEFVCWMESWLLRSMRADHGVALAHRPETALAESDTTALDPEVLVSLLEDENPAGRSLARELIDSYQQEAPVAFSSMTEAAGAGDWEGVASAAHGLVSSCGTVGASSLAVVLRRIERLACGCDGEQQVAALFLQAERELHGSLDALRRL